MSSAKPTDQNTIELSFTALERRFSSGGQQSASGREQSTILDEVSILNSVQNVVILGGPGSGKTTTIKRLARKILMSPAAGQDDISQCPVIVRLRDLDILHQTLYEAIAETISLRWEAKLESHLSMRKYSELKTSHERQLAEKRIGLIERERDLRAMSSLPRNDLAADGNLQTQIEDLRMEIPRLESVTDDELVARATESTRNCYVGDKQLADVIPEILDEIECLLFVDGLDEVPASVRNDIFIDLRRLAESLKSARVVASCRTGDFTRISGFDTITICPLRKEQLEEITSLWIERSGQFLEELELLPYSDLADRPSFLTYLLSIFSNVGELPSQPSDVYRRIIWLVLKEWDDQRDVRRGSLYANFYEERKLDFLAALAFHLTYRLKRTAFTRADLLGAFEAIAENFDLEEASAEDVVGEIESHTGLLNEAGYERYEFSHSSLQEYLTAYHMVRGSLATELSAYLQEYPAPLAVAAALSADAGQWLAGILLRRFSNLEKGPLLSLVTRMNQERPKFASSPLLGYALVLLFGHVGRNAWPELMKILRSKNARLSLRESLVNYTIEPRGESSSYRLELSPWGDAGAEVNRLRGLGLHAPLKIAIRLELFQELITVLSMTLKAGKLPHLGRLVFDEDG